MSSPRILVVDDEAQLRHAIVRSLIGHDYAVREAEDGATAVREFSAFKPDVVLLDLVLPDVSGVEVCREIRRLRDTPIIVLSVLGEERAKIDALDAGADDYLTKPFGVGELLARVRVALRHGGSNWTGGPIIRADGLLIDLERRRVTLEDRELHLSPTEYSLLMFLAMHAGKVLTYPTILRAVWGEEYSASTNVLRTAINQLRIRLNESASSPRFIRTHMGVGYQFADPEPDA
jgi:two-component system KDP operon response regulator KdpE